MDGCTILLASFLPVRLMGLLMGTRCSLALPIRVLFVHVLESKLGNARVFAISTNGFD